MIFVKISQNLIKSAINICLKQSDFCKNLTELNQISLKQQISVHSLWHVHACMCWTSDSSENLLAIQGIQTYGNMVYKFMSIAYGSVTIESSTHCYT